MNSILNKKEFYKMVLRDRYPASALAYSCGKNSNGNVEFFCTPLGTLVRADVGDGILREIKMYDRSGGNFEIQNVFCGDNLTEIEKGIFVGVSAKLQIEDTVGRSFLIKTDSITVIAKAEMLPKKLSTVDKLPHLVYN